ncbi:MAG: NAD(P)/FAD-dependent oxidoreductase [Saprospiraceae bacterium]|nr:NAD(P)/FAD-dependent oxidoreductase [Saprospiraceae bacterium]
MDHVVIIGNGISGVTAARWVRKLSDKKITIISSESKHFFSRTALMYIYMGHMRYEDTKPYEDWFWKKNRIELIHDHVDAIDFDNNTLSLKKGEAVKYDKLVLALGSKSNMFGWPGQDLKAVSGLYHLQDLHNMEAYSKGLKRAVICGGGLIGIEMAEMFHSRNIPVTMLVREESYWNNVLPAEESQMVSEHIKKNHIDLRLGVNLGEIKDDGTGTACGVVVKESGEQIDCGYVGLTAGVSPNVGWLKESGLDIGRGIKVNAHLQTNKPNVYAIGDCAELENPNTGRRGVEAIWYTGRMMGETVAYNICDKKVAYDPGLWFNSAKFIDIEYQVYGDVPAQMPEDMATLFWKHDDNEKSIRINYDKSSKVVLGFNLFGIRYRHEVCEKWILNQTHIEEVLQNLALANFDPEFCKMYEQNLIDTYNNQTGQSITLKSKRGLNKVLSFLSK